MKVFIHNFFFFLLACFSLSYLFKPCILQKSTPNAGCGDVCASNSSRRSQSASVMVVVILGGRPPLIGGARTLPKSVILVQMPVTAHLLQFAASANCALVSGCGVRYRDIVGIDKQIKLQVRLSTGS